MGDIFMLGGLRAFFSFYLKRIATIIFLCGLGFVFGTVKQPNDNLKLNQNVFIGTFSLNTNSNISELSPNADCLNTTSYGTATAPTSGCQSVTISTCNFAGEYATVTGVVSGRTYLLASSIATDYLTIRQGTSNGIIIAQGITPVIAPVTANGNIYIHVSSDSNCGTQSSCRTTTVMCSSCAGPSTYCAVTSTNTSYGIGNFTTTNGNDNINNTTGSGAYTDYTTQFVSKEAGGLVQFSISPVSSSTYGYGLWIDWNNNKCFFDGGELIALTTAYVSGNFTGNIIVPAGTPPGDYRIRVVNNWLSASPTPCGDLGNQGYGEAEDYTFRVISLVPCSGTPTGGTTVLNPNSGSPGSTVNGSVSGSSVGTGFTYQWQYSDNGNNWTNITGQGNSNLTTTAIGTFGIRYYRRKITCTASGKSAFSSAAAYTTLLQYCTPTTTGGSTYYISNFTTTGGNADINNNSGGSATGYQDFSNLILNASPGTTINYSFNVAGGSNYGRAMWIDWNENGTFESTEQVLSSSSYGYPPFTGNFTIPVSAAGIKRIRVLASYTPSNPSNPCSNTGMGEYEDYTMVIAPLTPCSGMPTGGTTVLNPNSGTPGSTVNGSVTGSTIASGLTYQWQYSDSGSSWTNITGQSGPYLTTTAIGTAGIRYYRRKITCSASGKSDFSTAAPYTTMVCTPSTTSDPSRLYIKNVKFLGSLNSTDVVNLNNGYGNGYQNFTSLWVGTQKPRQAQGMGINIHAQLNSWRGRFKVWVDWNNNLNFESSELVYDTDDVITNAVLFGFIIPASQPPGDYRLRIRVMNDDYESFGDFDSCNPFTGTVYGEAEDYLFTVVQDCPDKVTAVNINPGDGERCGPGKVTLTAQGPPAATYNWYDSEFGGANLQTGMSNTYLTNNLPVGLHTFWVTVTGSCETLYRTPVPARVSPIPILDFTQIEPDICGVNTSMSVSSSGDFEEVSIINEKFNSGLGVFKNSGSAGYTDGDWINRPNPYAVTRPPYYITRPAISSGFNNGKFAVSVTDLNQISPLNKILELTNNVNASLLTGLKLEFDLYYQSYIENNSPNEYFDLEVSVNNGSWTLLERYTSTQGNPGRFLKKSYDFSAYDGVGNLKIRFVNHSEGSYSGWFPNIAAIDNIRLYGQKELENNFSWSAANIDLYNADCVTPYSGATPDICAVPTPSQIENNASWTVVATATLSNGCSASGIFTITNNSKVWNPGNGSANWSAANWKPTNSIPTANNCVVVRKEINLNTGTNGVAKNIEVESVGKLTIKDNASLTVTDFINSAGADNFIVKNKGNLVQINENAVNTGEITAQNEFIMSGHPSNRLEYNFAISPVIGQNIKNIFSPPSGRALIYNESTDYFVESDGNYVLGRGYAVREPAGSPQGPKIANFVGVPYNGNQSPFPLSKTGDGYNLIGNPYPSTLDIKMLYDNNSSKIESTYRFWDNRGNSIYVQMGPLYTGNQYAKYNAVSNTGNAAPQPEALALPSKTPTRYISKGNAFLVQAKNSGSIQLKNSYRSLQQGATYTGKSNTETEEDKYWLTLTTPGSLMLMTAIAYFEGGNNDFWIDDSESDGGSDDFYSIVGDHQLSIQGKAPFTTSDIVPVGFRAFKTGFYKLAVFDKEGKFAEGQTIYVKDKMLNNLFHNLSFSPYYFKSEPGKYNNRFEIFYGRPAGFGINTSKMLRIDKKDYNIVVSSDLDKITEVEIFDLVGLPVYKNEKVNAKELRIPLKQFGKQLVVVVAKTEVGEIENRMIEINN